MKYQMFLFATVIVAIAAESGKSDEPLLENIGKRTRGTDWPKFLGPTADSRSSETGIITRWPEAGPRIVWQRELGTSYGIGCVSRGRYFQFDRIGDKATLFCLNAETGKPIWQFEYATDYEDLYGYNGGPRCSPIVDGNRVYIFGVEGMLHCLRASSGEVIWKVNTAKEFSVVQNFFGVGSTPVVEGDTLIAIVGGSSEEDQDLPPGRLDLVKGNGSGIVAFDKLTGKVIYKITDELASYASPRTATVNGRRWCFAFTRGGLVGFQPATGKVDFHFPWRARILESVNASMPVVVNDEVFISETYGPGSCLLKVRPGGNDIVWQDELRKRDKAMKCHWNTPVYHDGHLYGCSGRNSPDADLRCIDWKSGEVKWTVPNRSRTSLLYVDGHFVCLGEYGTLQLFRANPEKFELVAETTLKRKTAGREPREGFDATNLLRYPCWAAPILSHGLMYVRGRDRLVCLELIPPVPE